VIRGKNETQSLGVPANDIGSSEKVHGDRFSVTLISNSAVDWTMRPQWLRTLLTRIHTLFIRNHAILLTQVQKPFDPEV
jgi:hypothetical protein